MLSLHERHIKLTGCHVVEAAHDEPGPAEEEHRDPQDKSDVLVHGQENREAKILPVLQVGVLQIEKAQEGEVERDVRPERERVTGCSSTSKNITPERGSSCRAVQPNAQYNNIDPREEIRAKVVQCTTILVRVDGAGRENASDQLDGDHDVADDLERVLDAPVDPELAVLLFEVLLVLQALHKFSLLDKRATFGWFTVFAHFWFHQV